MAIVEIDGFDKYADINDATAGPWIAHNSATIEASNGRFSGGNLLLQSSNTNKEWIRRCWPGAQTTFICAFAVRFVTLQTVEMDFARFLDGLTVQIALRRETVQGFIELHRGSYDHADNGTTSAGLLATGTKTLAEDTWYWIEVKATIDNTTGSVEVRVDETTDINVTGADTQNTANAQCDGLTFFANSGLGETETRRYDDYVLLDTTGGVNDDLLGDRRIISLYPNADTAQADFTPQGGGTNFSEVDDGSSGPDDDTTYVESSTVGHIDLYDMDDLPVTPNSIDGCMLSVFGKKTDAGGRTARSKLKSNVTTSNGTTFSPTTTYQWQGEDTFDTDPDTGSAWTEAGINAVQCGYEVVS